MGCISFVLVLCFLLNSCIAVFANDEKSTSEYYSFNVYTRRIDIVHMMLAEDEEKYGEDTLQNDIPYDETQVTFMLRKDPGDSEEKLYIMAEDVMALTDYKYLFKQTPEEFVLMTDNAAEIVRFKFNSDRVIALFGNQLIEYKTPFNSLYENDVAWVPYEFVIELFEIIQSPTDEGFYFDVPQHTYFSAAYEAYSNMNQYKFDWVNEVHQSLEDSKKAHKSAGFIDKFNKLVSLEPSQMASVILSWFGKTYIYDAEYANKIAKVFIQPAAGETEQLENTMVGKGSKHTVDFFKFVDDAADIKFKSVKDAFSQMEKNSPALKKNKMFSTFKNIATGDKAGKFNKVLDEFGNSKVINGGTEALRAMIEVAELMECYNILKNKSERANYSLEQYAYDCDRDEADVFLSYVSSGDEDFADAFLSYVSTNYGNYINEAVDKAGLLNGYFKAFKIGWKLATSLDIIEKNIESAQYRLMSDYAVVYQNESITYLNNDLDNVKDGDNKKSIDKAINSFYAYLKFSYIARDSAAASYRSMIASGLVNDENEANLDKLIKSLDSRNRRVSELLATFEKDYFAPYDCSITKWDDTVYAEMLRENGTKVDCPVQNSVPVADEALFPGEDDPGNVSQEQAAELVEKAMDKYSMGLAQSLFGDIYSYRCISKYYDKEKKKSFYVIQMFVEENPDAIFLVPFDGSAVYLATLQQDGQTYYYLEADLLNMNTQQLMNAMRQEVSKAIEEEGLLD